MPDDTQAQAVAPALDSANIHELFDQIAEKIIEQQEAIIGPIAVDQAKLVEQLKINWAEHDVDIAGDPGKAIDLLVAQYKELFGQIAVQTCKEAAEKILAELPSDKRPKSLA